MNVVEHDHTSMVRRYRTVHTQRRKLHEMRTRVMTSVTQCRVTITSTSSSFSSSSLSSSSYSSSSSFSSSSLSSCLSLLPSSYKRRQTSLPKLPISIPKSILFMIFGILDQKSNRRFAVLNRMMYQLSHLPLSSPIQITIHMRWYYFGQTGMGGPIFSEKEFRDKYKPMWCWIRPRRVICSYDSVRFSVNVVSPSMYMSPARMLTQMTTYMKTSIQHLKIENQGFIHVSDLLPLTNLRSLELSRVIMDSSIAVISELCRINMGCCRLSLSPNHDENTRLFPQTLTDLSIAIPYSYVREDDLDAQYLYNDLAYYTNMKHITFQSSTPLYVPQFQKWCSSWASLESMTLHCGVLHCGVLHCGVLHCGVDDAPAAMDEGRLVKSCTTVKPQPSVSVISSLTYVNLKFDDMTLLWPWLATLPRLSYLKLPFCIVDTTGIAGIETHLLRCTRLTSLDFPTNKILISGDLLKRFFQSYRAPLCHLSLSQMRCSDDSWIPFLSTFTSLTSLNLSHCLDFWTHLHVETIQSLRTLTSLTDLSLESLNIQPGGIQAVVETFPKLTTLNLRVIHGFSDADADLDTIIVGLPYLTTLHIFDDSLSTAGLQRFQNWQKRKCEIVPIGCRSTSYVPV